MGCVGCPPPEATRGCRLPPGVRARVAEGPPAKPPLGCSTTCPVVVWSPAWQQGFVSAVTNCGLGRAGSLGAWGHLPAGPGPLFRVLAAPPEAPCLQSGPHRLAPAPGAQPGAQQRLPVASGRAPSPSFRVRGRRSATGLWVRRGPCPRPPGRRVSRDHRRPGARRASSLVLVSLRLRSPSASSSQHWGARGSRARAPCVTTVRALSRRTHLVHHLL